MSTGNPYQASGGQKVPNYLVQAILATVCCCLPFGIVSIVYAAQVNGKLAAGDVAGAVQASNNAKMWSYIAIGLGAAGILIYLAFVAIAMMAGVAQAPQQMPPVEFQP